MENRSRWFRGSIYWVLLAWDRFSVSKPLSQKHGCTFLALQEAGPTSSFGGFGQSYTDLPRGAAMVFLMVKGTGEYPEPFENDFVMMQHGQQQQILQEAKNATKKKEYKECLMPGSHDPTMSEGHTVQEAVMRQNGMCDKVGQVRAFASLPFDLKKMEQKPVLVHVNHAGTGYFSCASAKHEGLFKPIELPQVPDFNDEEHLTLFAYKAILGSLWQDKLLLNGELR